MRKENSVSELIGIYFFMLDDQPYDFKQERFVKNVLEATYMKDCNGKPITTNVVTPLGSEYKVKHTIREWRYALVVGMLLYLDTN